MVSDEWRMVLLLCGLGAAGLLIIAAAAELSIQAERADQATNLAEVAAWQVSQVLEDVRRITREAAVRQARGELP
jgi:uncharacterized protein YcfJ